MRRNLEILLFIFLTMIVLFGCNLTQNNVVNDAPDDLNNFSIVNDDSEIGNGEVPDGQDGEVEDQNGNIELITIEEPGNISEITSPILVTGIAGPTFEQNIVVRLTDVEGNILAQEPTIIPADVGNAGAYMVELDFTVSEETHGRITVYDTSAMNGALLHAASVPVILLPDGTPIINVNLDNSEVIEIISPDFNTEVQNGEILVTGISEYFFESNLSIALCGSDGTGSVHLICGTEDNVLAVSYAMIESPDIGIGGPFSGMIEFSVTEETHVILVVYAMSPMDGGIEHLSSVPLILIP